MNNFALCFKYVYAFFHALLNLQENSEQGLNEKAKSHYSCFDSAFNGGATKVLPLIRMLVLDL